MGFDMWLKDKFSNLDNIDFAESVIERMRAKYSSTNINKDLSEEEKKQCEGRKVESELRFECMDMMDMSFAEATFDVVIDKATMDAIVTDNKDPWNYNDQVKERSSRTLRNCIRVLKSKGTFISISFDQPHFRKKLLLAPEFENQWTFSQKNIASGFGYYMFILKKVE
mmetsp:Transcript_11837/g.20015  ORF Transcript_11837/g.20015 Transcript_11837/m.20015 type:complete len:168 (-) Transcript_11837:38-541(-)